MPRQIETLPAITAPTAVSELDRSRALVTVTRPAYWGLDSAQYEDITPEMLKRARPENLRADLIGVPLKAGSFVVNYELDDGSRQSVALNPDEYKAIYRATHPGYLAATVESATRAGKDSLSSRDVLDAKSRENKTDALIKKYDVMQKRVNGLVEEHTLLTRLKEASGIYWRQRGHVDRLRIEIGNVLEVMIPNALTVVGQRRGWNDAKADLAKRSIEYRLFFTMPEKERMKEWGNLVGLLRDYDQYKINAFQDRMGRVQGFLRQIAPEVELGTTRDTK
jgi:hypothetical protein